MRIATLAFLITSFVAASAWADPPPWAGRWKHERDREYEHEYKHHGHGDHHARVVYVPVRRGPPAWGRVFERGSCDRTRISAAFPDGTRLGLVIGGALGGLMDGLDQGCALGALEALPDRREVVWQGPAGEPFRMMPVRSWEDGPDRYCREYQATALVGGRPQRVYGTACRQPDGQWEILD